MNNCILKSIFNPLSLGLYFGPILLVFGYLMGFMPEISLTLSISVAVMTVIAVYFSYAKYQDNCKDTA